MNGGKGMARNMENDMEINIENQWHGGMWAGLLAWRGLRLFVFLLMFQSLLACNEADLPQQRETRLAASQGDIRIAVVWPHVEQASLLKGVMLAQEEINLAGGISGKRKIRLMQKDDQASLTHGRQVAQEIANDPDVAAVIGHLNSYIAVPAASIYQQAGLLMITPGASGQKLTESANPLVFRSVPGNRAQGRQMADYAWAQGYKSIVLYYIKNDYGMDLANHFEQRANEIGLAIVDRRAYNMSGDNYSVVLKDWASFLQFDALFLIGGMPESAQIVRQVREVAIGQPIVAATGLDSHELIQLGGSAVEGMQMFTLFNGNDPRPEVARFNARFKSRFGMLPDSAAAQGYDALNLLAWAMHQAKSSAPTRVAGVLHGTRGWQGVSGELGFDAKGDLQGKPLARVVVRDGAFIFSGSPASNTVVPNSK